MISELTRVVKGVYSYSNTSIIFDSNPYLLAGNDLTLYFTDNDARFASRVVSVSGNTAVIDFSNRNMRTEELQLKLLIMAQD
jgi:hypothetical protein